MQFSNLQSGKLKIFTNLVTRFEKYFSTKGLTNYRVGFLYEDFSIRKLFKKVLKTSKDFLLIFKKTWLFSPYKNHTLNIKQTKHMH